jgi:hypothetical protein
LAQKNLHNGIEEGGLVIFSFNFPFPLEAIFCIPHSTCVSTKLARISMKTSFILSLKEIFKVGVLSFGSVEVPTRLEKMGNRLILEQVLP